MKRLLLAFSLLLTSCGVLTPPTNHVVVGGIPIVYRNGKFPGAVGGIAVKMPAYCIISIDPEKAKNNIPLLLAHEYGHCVDRFKLNFDHNGVKDEGLQYGEWFRSPAEGYAQFYAIEYVNRCGSNLSVFQSPWADNSTLPCELADPRSIGPK